MPMRERTGVILLLVSLLLFFPVPGLRADYPEIKKLGHTDPLFKQLQADIQSYHKYISRRVDEEGASLPPLQLFKYRLRPDDDLFSLAARFNLPYDTLATLNRLERASDLAQHDFLLVPNLPGIFVHPTPANAFEEIVTTLRTTPASEARQIMVQDAGGARSCLFLAGESFHPVERAYFLQILFRFPVPSGRLTSAYGSRDNPFTGHPEFHHGIDIAAAAGTEVVTARAGTVRETGRHPVLGNYVIILHAGGYETVYGHLEEVFVGLKQTVTSGMIIGKVGTTGMSTGPHLHFEVRRRGSSRDPLPLLPGSESSE
jgi:murein DD-endopeptidase MepM/ murein hydrolase activator NlpD